MTDTIHSLAPEHLPAFLPNADGSDMLFTLVIVGTIALILVLGSANFTLHSIPEKVAHDSNSMQFQVIGILALLALLTHNNLFWVIALLLAAVRFPDFLKPIESIAESLQEMRKKGEKDA
jgi:hypothetical protein